MPGNLQNTPIRTSIGAAKRLPDTATGPLNNTAPAYNVFVPSRAAAETVGRVPEDSSPARGCRCAAWPMATSSAYQTRIASAHSGGCSSVGRALGCGPRGRGFKSRHPPFNLAWPGAGVGVLVPGPTKRGRTEPASGPGRLGSAPFTSRWLAFVAVSAIARIAPRPKRRYNPLNGYPTREVSGCGNRRVCRPQRIRGGRRDPR